MHRPRISYLKNQHYVKDVTKEQWNNIENNKFKQIFPGLDHFQIQCINQRDEVFDKNTNLSLPADQFLCYDG